MAPGDPPPLRLCALASLRSSRAGVSATPLPLSAIIGLRSPYPGRVPLGTPWLRANKSPGSYHNWRLLAGGTAFACADGDPLAGETGPWLSDTVGYAYKNRLLATGFRGKTPYQGNQTMDGGDE